MFPDAIGPRPLNAALGARQAMEAHLKNSARCFRTIAAAALIVVLVAGCKTRSTVGMQMVLPPMAEVMDVPKDKTFLMASPVMQPLPAYPSGVQRGASARVCIEFVIDENGAVASTTPLYGLPECPALQEQLDPQFIASAVEAASRWQFLAAAICTFPEGVEPTEDCSGDEVVVTTVAIKIAYVFTFQSGGRVTAVARRD